MLNRWQKIKLEIKHILLNTFLFVLAFFIPARWHNATLLWLSKRHARLQDFSPALSKLHEAYPAYAESVAHDRLAYHWLVDQLDFYLTLRFGQKWFDRYVDVEDRGLPPRGTPALTLTFHYGQGFWALDYLRKAGFNTSMIYLPALVPSKAPWGEKFANWIAWRRIRQFERLCGSAGIPADRNSLRAMRSRLTRVRESVAIMPDVPPQEWQRVQGFTLFGRPAGMPVGGLQVALQIGVPVIVYSMVANPETGRRKLVIHGHYQGLDSEQMVKELGTILQKVIDQEPAAWYLWPWIGSFYAAGAASNAASADAVSNHSLNRTENTCEKH